MNKQQKIKSFTDLKAWQYSHQLVLLIYELAREFPNHEKFGLTNQMRRAAVSITSNIAEGFSRFSDTDKVRIYMIAKGSAIELQNQLLIGRDVGYISPQKFSKAANLSVVAVKLIGGLCTKTKRP